MSVKRSRREFLKTSAGLLVLSTANSANDREEINVECNARPFSTPIAIDDSLDVVVSAAYGELTLCPERRYWRWEIDTADPVTIDYEVRVPEDTSPPNVLVVDPEGWRTYKTIVSDHPVVDGPLVDWCTRNLGTVGNHKLPCGLNTGNVNLENIGPRLKSIRDKQLWRDESPGSGSSPMFEIDTVDCLSNPSSRPIRESETISAGRYYVVFDWTDDVLSEPRSKRVSAEVAVRARKPLDQAGEESEYEGEVSQLYDSLPEEEGALVTRIRSLARDICDSAETIPVKELQTAVPQASRVSSTLNILLTLLEDRIGYAPTFRSELMTHASTWGRSGMTALPVVSSANQLIEDACVVATAEPEVVTDEIEKMLTSLGILVADLLLVKFGAASKAARIVTRAAHQYLLGYLRRVLGLQAYVVLLRELYTLITSGIVQVFNRIREVTRKLAQETEFIDDADVQWVEEQDERDIESLRPTFTMRSPECTL